jgi:hypothetical protein
MIPGSADTAAPAAADEINERRDSVLIGFIPLVVLNNAITHDSMIKPVLSKILSFKYKVNAKSLFKWAFTHNKKGWNIGCSSPFLIP